MNKKKQNKFVKFALCFWAIYFLIFTTVFICTGERDAGIVALFGMVNINIWFAKLYE